MANCEKMPFWVLVAVSKKGSVLGVRRAYLGIRNLI